MMRIARRRSRHSRAVAPPMRVSGAGLGWSTVAARTHPRASQLDTRLLHHYRSWFAVPQIWGEHCSMPVRGSTMTAAPSTLWTPADEAELRALIFAAKDLEAIARQLK